MIWPRLLMRCAAPLLELIRPFCDWPVIQPRALIEPAALLFFPGAHRGRPSGHLSNGKREPERSPRQNKNLARWDREKQCPRKRQVLRNC